MSTKIKYSQISHAEVNVFDYGADESAACNADAFNAAINSAPGVDHITIIAEGQFNFQKPINWNRPGITLDGRNRVYSMLIANKADLSDGLLPNCVIACTAGGGGAYGNAVNGTLKSIRFHNISMSGGAYINAEQSGVLGGTHSAFSWHLHDLWSNASNSSTAFYKGGFYNSWAHDIQFESSGKCFDFSGVGVGSVIISNCDVLLCFDEFIHIDTGASNVTVSNIGIAEHRRGNAFTFRNVAGFQINNVQFRTAAYDASYELQFGYFWNCQNGTVSNFECMSDHAGNDHGVTVVSSDIKFSHGWFYDLVGYVGSPFSVITLSTTSGIANNVSFDDIYCRSGWHAITTTDYLGTLTLNNCVFTKTIGTMILQGGSIFSANVDIKGCELSYAGYGSGTSATLLMDYKTSGAVTIQGCRLGAITADMNAMFKFVANGGSVAIGNNVVVDNNGTPFISAGNTQEIAYVGNNVGGSSYRTTAATPVGAVVPLFLGEMYYQSTGDKWFKAFGTATNTDWTILN